MIDLKETPAMGAALLLSAALLAPGATRADDGQRVTVTPREAARIAARGPVSEYLSNADYHYLRDLGVGREKIAAITLIAHHAGVEPMWVARRYVFGGSLPEIAAAYGMDLDAVKTSAGRLAREFPRHEPGMGRVAERPSFPTTERVAGMRQGVPMRSMPPEPSAAGFDREGMRTMLAAWPEPSRKAAKMMMDQYGQPNGATPTRLVWQAHGPWKEIIVYRDPVQHNFPMPHPDVLEQVIDYQVPVDKYDELAAYDGSVIVERTKGTMAARCDKEPMNYLALNLAHDIITGKRSVQEARKFYAETAMAFMKGDKHPYTQRLMFDVPRQAGDTDHPVARP